MNKLSNLELLIAALFLLSTSIASAEPHLIAGNKNLFLLCAKIDSGKITSYMPSCIEKNVGPSFIKKEESYFLNTKVWGIDKNGVFQDQQITLDLSETAVSPLISGRDTKEISLVSSELVDFHLVNEKPINLSSTTVKGIHKKSLSLWHEATKEIPNRANEKSLTFKKIEAFSIGKSPNLAIIKVYGEFLDKKGESKDSRAEFFFIFDLKSNTCLYSRFGHKEWSPDASGLLAIKPSFYFSIGDGSTYMLAEVDYAWERNRYVIMDINNASVVAESLEFEN